MMLSIHFSRYVRAGHSNYTVDQVWGCEFKLKKSADLSACPSMYVCKVQG